MILPLASNCIFKISGSAGAVDAFIFTMVRFIIMHVLNLTIVVTLATLLINYEAAEMTAHAFLFAFVCRRTRFNEFNMMCHSDTGETIELIGR